MTRSDFSIYIDAVTNETAQNLIDKGDTSDDIAFGKLSFLLALRRAVDKKATAQDLGLLGAINDSLQKLGVLPASKTLLSDLQD